MGELKTYYVHRGITIYHGDCREVLRSIAPVDAVVTDPPYGEVNRASSGLRSLNKGVADVETVAVEWIAATLPKFAPSLYVWCGMQQVSALRAGFVGAGMTTRLAIWEKTNPSPMNGQHLWLSALEACVFARRSGATFRRFCASPVWRGPTRRETEHPTEKPLWLARELIDASSPSAGTVLDPFMGSGTTLRAAKDLGRRAIGIEIEERYCEIAAKRLAQEVFDFEGAA